MYSRRTMLMSSLSGAVGMILASFGVRTNPVLADDEVTRNRKWLQGYYTDSHDKTWIGYDGTRFKQWRYPYLTHAEDVYYFSATKQTGDLRTISRIKTFSHQFIANVGEDNFKDMLEAECRDFEFAYYAGDLTGQE